MRRGLNLRFLFWTCGSLLVLTIGVHFLHAFQVQRSVGALETSGDRAAQDKDFDHAVMYYAQYLTCEPGNVDVIAKLAAALDKFAVTAADRLRVSTLYEQVINKDPSRSDIRLQLVHRLIAQFRLREAIYHLGVLIPDAKNKAELEHILGWCEEAEGDYVKSVDAFRRAVAVNPHALNTYALMADVLQSRLHDDESATKALDEMIAHNPNDYHAYLIRARFLVAKAANLEAEADFRKAQELNPDDAQVLIAVAKWAQAKGNVEEAASYLERGLKLYPKDTTLIKALANLELDSGHRHEAMELLKRSFATASSPQDLELMIIDLLIDEKQTKEALSHIDQLRQRGAPPEMTDYFRARLAINDEQWNEAQALLEKAQKTLERGSEWSSRVNALLGSCYQQRGDYESAVAAYQRAVNLEPGWLIARVGLGEALLDLGRTDDALDELRQVSQAPTPPNEVWTILAGALIQHSYAAKIKNWDEAGNAVTRALEQNPRAVEPRLLKAGLLTAQGNIDAAAAILQDYAAADPGQVAFPLALADLYQRNHEVSQAESTIDGAAKRFGDRFELRVARARLAARRGDVADQRLLVQLGENLGRYTDAERAKLWRELGNELYRLGNVTDAATLWARIAKAQPADKLSRLALFESAARMGQYEQARRWLAELQAIDGDDGVYARYASAALAIAQSSGDPAKLEQARRLLQPLISQTTSWAKVYVLLSRIDSLEGDNDRALKNRMKAFDLGERERPFVYELVKDLAIRPSYRDQGANIVAKMQEKGPLNPELARLAAEMAMSNRDFQLALSFVKQAVREDTGDYRDLLWSAHIYEIAGDEDNVTASLTRALSAGKNIPETWIAAIETDVRRGEVDSALSKFGDARLALAGPRWLLAEPRLLHALGQVDRAESAYAHAIFTNLNDFVFLMTAADFFLATDQPAKAEPFLAKTLKIPLVPSEVQIRARQNRALAISASGDLSKVDEALNILALNPHSLANDRTVLLVQAQDGQKRKAALRELDASFRLIQATAREEFEAAKLHALSGNSDRVEELMFDLLADNPDNPQFLAFYARFLFATGDSDKATLYLQRLARLQPDYVRTTLLQKTMRGF